MEKKELAKDFIYSFKKALNITTLYSKEHPLFVKGVEEFAEKVDFTLRFINAIQVDVAIDFLLFSEEKFSDPEYAELAKKMHLHKIKRIEIKQGIIFEELAFLLNRINRSLKDLIKGGSLSLTGSKLAHLSIEEIDYYELLKKEGGEPYKDIWVYLLSDVVKNEDEEKILELADSFGEMVNHFTIKEILENSELYDNIKNFLSYLKNKDKDKFTQCSRDLANYIFNVMNILSDSDLEKIKGLFSCFDENDFADILIGVILSTDESENFSFDFFFRVVDAKIQQAVASLTVKSIREKFLGDKQKAYNRVEALLKAAEKYPFSEVYKNAFASLLDDIASTRIFTIDKDSLYLNYQFILLNLLSREKEKDSLGLIVDKISIELEKILKKTDIAYLKVLLGIIKAKKAEDPQMATVFEKLDNQIILFIEDNLWKGTLGEDFQYFIDYAPSSVSGIDVYLKKIFDENQINATIVKIFLKFFPESLDLFFSSLEKKNSDIEFNERLIKSLKEINNDSALNMLKRIYSISNNYIKNEVITALSELDKFDKELALSILRKEDVFLKKEALLMRARDEKTKREALETLFLINSPWGIKNKVLLGNISVVEDAELKDAKEFLVAISKKHFFWNWNIIRKAREVLDKWKL